MQSVNKGRERTLQIVTMAMMVALIFIFSRFLGITTDVIHLGFDFLPVVLIACLYGPVWAAVTYMVGDLVCAILMPFGAINPGLTVIAGIIGLVYGFADFNEDTWWNLGYADQASWAYYGSPRDRTADGRYREIQVDDSVGVTLAAGVSWRPDANFEVDLSLRHTWLEPDCEFGYRRKGSFQSVQGGDFTLDHLTVALTGSYVF